VASIDTYLKYSEAVGTLEPVARPPELAASTAIETRTGVTTERVARRRRKG
jgi:hypothetical protein